MPATSGSRSPDDEPRDARTCRHRGSAADAVINLNPFDWLGDKAKEGLADGWTAVMISIWSAGLWLLEAVFKTLDRFLTPDLTDPGLVGLHSISLWISLVVAVVIGFAQIGQAAIRRDGTSLATLLVGLAQYGAVSHLLGRRLRAARPGQRRADHRPDARRPRHQRLRRLPGRRRLAGQGRRHRRRHRPRDSPPCSCSSPPPSATC